MDDATIERQRATNQARILKRALDACLQTGPEADKELEILLIGPHGKTVVLGILESGAATQAALKRGAKLWQPFEDEGHLLYELVADRSPIGIQRVKNLLAAGWNPNLTLPGSRRTALMRVANNWTDEHRELTELLLAAGADPEHASVSGQTALDYAPTTMRNFIREYHKNKKPTRKAG